MGTEPNSGIDPRAYSESRIEPPMNLPHVSRRALKRVRDPLPIPESCRYCGPRHPVFIAHHSEIYRGGRSYGDWPYVYLCDCCGAYVGLHPHTDIPLGILADHDLRLARVKSKKRFMEVSDLYGWSRSEAYHWLAQSLGIPVRQCHFAWFDVDDCAIAERACKAKIDSFKRRGKGGKS